MTNLEQLILLCKAEVSITINENINDYCTIQEYFNRLKEYNPDIMSDVDDELIEKMTNNNCLVEINAYSSTPVGFFTIYHYNVEKAIEEMLKTAKEQS